MGIIEQPDTGKRGLVEYVASFNRRQYNSATSKYSDAASPESEPRRTC